MYRILLSWPKRRKWKVIFPVLVLTGSFFGRLQFLLLIPINLSSKLKVSTVAKAMIQYIHIVDDHEISNHDRWRPEVKKEAFQYRTDRAPWQAHNEQTERYKNWGKI